ncbi:hypothetical protein [Endozoicomonas numazuensis]|uniref:Uncharacterized protein n=1 Tax=Endozoicomonas numazuensis TaxID=1137799 RepID=A0A081NK57_9GAMM|nr:hypothetical protein [Endozoicomonas numazuensis]KEQ18830.1 hypothetical protein GZ78_01770 [Endozoicomonas numazuensis]
MIKGKNIDIRPIAERGKLVRLHGVECFKVMLFATVVATGVNTVLLKTAPLMDIEVGAGGLFGLLQMYFGGIFHDLGFSAVWSATVLPQPGSLGFYVFFHSLIGLLMAGLYVYSVEKYLAGSGIKKGAVFALLSWLINSILVLPLLGKGFAGSEVLDSVGLIYFFVANGVYGVLLGFLYEKLSDKQLVNDGGE